MKKLFLSLTAIFAVLMIFNLSSCQPTVEVEKKDDYTAPATVTNLEATNADSAVELTWTDPTDKDLYGIEVTFAEKSTSRAVAPMVKDAIMVAPGTEFAKITGLTNGKTYTFTVKAVDTSGNKSEASTKEFTPALIEGEPMTISFEQSTTAKTKENVTVTVNIKTSRKVKTVKYASGEKPLSYFANGGTTISESPYTFEASENGIYTVYVLDVDGRRETSFIEVTNIDKTAPEKVTNFVATYSSVSKKIKLTWANPTDKDFAGLTLSYGKAGQTATQVQLAKNITTYEIANITADNAEYSISLVTKDDVENVSEANIITFIAKTGPVVNQITLNRTHLDSIMTDRNISVSIAGSNFNELTSNGLLVQVFEGSNNQPAVTATFDKENNTATATVTAPVPASPTASGKTYYVKAIVNGSAQTDVTAEFVVSAPATVSSITLDKSKIKFGTQDKVKATIKGTNFDIRGVTKIALLDSNNTEVTESTQIVALDANTSDKEFSADIALPNTSGVYTVAVYFDNVKENKTSTLQVYDDATITSVSAPTASPSYGGNILPVTIKGKNFTSPEVTAASFSSTSGITNFKIVDDTTATAKIICPYSAGETQLTVNCGNASATGTLVVKDYSSYKTGDLILSDGTKVDYAESPSFTEDQKSKAVGIVMGFNTYGAPLMLGLKQSSSYLMWAPSDTTGYNTKFTGIICTPSKTGSGAASTATYTGDTDGSDNWEYVKSIDPDGAANASTNYPAFNYAATYGTTNSLPERYQDGWYLPSIAELAEVYKNKDVLNKVLTALGNDKATTIRNNYYWSSSQYASSYFYAWELGFSDGSVTSSYVKTSNSYVLVVRAFN